MPLWSRIANVFRGDRVSREIEEEMQSHLIEAIEEGRDPLEARRAFGSVMRQGEASRDIRLLPWLDSLRADAVFGWRQLQKNRVASAAAILSLALAIGACLSAFRLIDALLLRPLPVAHPERLYALSRQSVGPNGVVVEGDSCAYPMFRQMRADVKDQAELIAASGAWRVDLTYGSAQETEKAHQQYVSGWMFGAFGLRPALGRLFTEADDITPGAHPYAVLSYDYWTRRFARDPQVIGRTYRTGGDVYQIVGVVQGPFTGTEPGTITDLFIPTMMVKNRGIERSDYRWFRTLVMLRPGAGLPPVREKLRAAFRAFLEESVKMFAGIPKAERDGYLSQKLLLQPAAAGVSSVQKYYARSLGILGLLVALVLLIACANVANLMTARAAARGREMALRVSIGAGRWRLVQLVLVECAWLASVAAVAGAWFAWWSAPLVVGMISSPDNPARLALPADWRFFGFAAAVALAVTLLFGLAPALRASAVKPASALKGGDDPHARRRLMHALLAAQVAFCFLVLFVGGLFAASFGRLTSQPTGFSSERLLTLETVTPRPQPAAFWRQAAEQLRAVPGVEAAALCEWPLLDGESWNGFISVNGAPPGPVASYFLSVSPGWLGLMKIPLLGGRDFHDGDAQPGSAIVNRAFARQYFGGANPVGRSFEVVANEGKRSRYQVVGLAADALYERLREPMQPVAYFPFQLDYARATFVVRTASTNPLALASTLRREVPRARPEFRVSAIHAQADFLRAETLRERLLAMLALFFAVVALALAGIGLYGVLEYSVLERRREIGIRVAIGAQPGDIARRVTADVFRMAVVGAAAGVALGLATTRYIEALLFQVKPADPAMLVLPALSLLAVTAAAALPAVRRALRLDPVAMLRAD